jgi:hypothetical protein
MTILLIPIITKLPNNIELLEYPNGDNEYYLNNYHYRADNPLYSFYNRWHRLDGPAVERHNGDKFWFQYGKNHRENGPAIELHTGQKYWFINGERIPCKTQKQFEQLMRLKAFW